MGKYRILLHRQQYSPSPTRFVTDHLTETGFPSGKSTMVFCAAFLAVDDAHHLHCNHARAFWGVVNHIDIRHCIVADEGVKIVDFDTKRLHRLTAAAPTAAYSQPSLRGSPTDMRPQHAADAIRRYPTLFRHNRYKPLERKWRRSRGRSRRPLQRRAKQSCSRLSSSFERRSRTAAQNLNLLGVLLNRHADKPRQYHVAVFDLLVPVGEAEEVF